MTRKSDLVLSLSSLILLFIIDSQIPSGFSFWIFYFFPVLFFASRSSSGEAFKFALFATFIMAAGFVFPIGVTHQLTTFLSRIAGILTLWILVFQVIKRAEAYKKLSEEAELKEAIFQNMTEGLVITDSGGNIVIYNKAARDICRNDLFPTHKNRHLWRYCDLDENRIPLRKWPTCRVLQRERFQNFTCKIVNRRTGESFYVSISASPILDRDDRLVLGVLLIRDISGIVEAENKLKTALETSEKRAAEVESRGRYLNAVMEQISEVIFITDQANCILYASRFSEELLGLPFETVVTTPEKKRASSWKIFHSDGRTPADYREMPLYQAVHRGKIIDKQEWTIKSDGMVKTVLVNSRPIKDPQGRIRGAVSGWRDISDLKQVLNENISQRILLETILDNAPVIIILLQCPENRFAFVNSYFQKISGIETKEIQGKTIKEIWPEIDEKVSSIIKASCQKNEPISAEDMLFEIKTKNGTKEIYVSFDLVPLSGDESKKNILAIVRETTENVTTRKQLEETAAFDEAILSNINDALFIIDSKGKLLKTNPAAIRMYGLETIELYQKTGKSESALHAMFKLDGKEIPFERWPVNRLPKGEIISGEELILKDLKRQSEWVGSFSGVPVKDKNGNVEMAILIARDISEQVKSRREAQIQAARYEAIVNNMTDGLIIADNQGKIKFFNPAALSLFGFRSIREVPDDKLGLQKLFGMEDLHGNPISVQNRPLSRALRGEKFTGVEMSITDLRNKKAMIANFSGTPVIDKEGNRILVILTVRDVTELRQRTREAQESKRILDAMLEHLPAGVEIADSRLNIIMSSKYDRDTLGECSGETPEKRADDCMMINAATGKGADSDTHPLNRAIKEGVVTVNEEWRLRDIHGNEKTVLFNATPLIDKENVRVGAIQIWVDISERKHSEVALQRLLSQNRRQKTFLAALLEQVPAGIFLIRPDKMRIEMANSYFRSVIGKEISGIKGIHLDELPELVKSGSIERIKTVYREKRRVSLQELPVKIGDKIIYLNTDDIPIFDEHGEVYQIMVMVVDVTSLVESRKKQEFLTARYQAIVNTVIEGLIIVDPDGMILEINPAAFQFFELPTGLMHHSELAGYVELSRLDGTPVLLGEDPISQVLRNKPVSLEVFAVKIKRSGKMRYAMISGTSFTFDSGQKYHVVINIGDVSELIFYQQQLRDERNFNEAIFQTQGALVAILDSNGTIQKFNKAAESDTGYSLSEVKDHCLCDLFPVEEKQRWREQVIKAAPENFPVRIENYILTKDGKKRFIHWRTSIIADEEVKNIIATGIDITDRLEAEYKIRLLNSELRRRASELEYSNRELEAFSYSVSHDLRSPLGTVGGFANLLREDYESKLDIQGKEYIKVILTGVKKMKSIIEDMLRLSRISKKEFSRSSINLSDMVSSFLNELHKLEPGRNVRFNIQENVIADADPRLVHLALENLLKNAWKFTSKRDPAIIEFGVFRQDGETVYFIKDNGAGFDMSQADRLFVSFQRLHSDKEYGGTGIGLPIVMRVILRHGGRVWAKGEIDKGASFYFTLQ
ncbi:MAG: PAS domain S-box protein [Fibrobacter sp.]|nr:PAS domain S-box protein [Fibrobacter sp.]